MVFLFAALVLGTIAIGVPWLIAVFASIYEVMVLGYNGPDSIGEWLFIWGWTMLWITPATLAWVIHSNYM